MTYHGNLINNPLAADRLRYDILYHTDLSRDSGNTVIGLPIDRINWENYDLVVIDESHNFRNGNGTNSKGGEKRESLHATDEQSHQTRCQDKGTYALRHTSK